MTPIEAAARALAKEDPRHMHWSCYRHMVVAVLKAIREPTARMAVAGANQLENGDGQLHRRKWQAMIDAALAEA